MKSYNISKETQKAWDEFLSRFTVDAIKKLEKKDYVIGNQNKKSFCYLVERKLSELGGMRGATSSKFGMWYGVHGQDKVRKYRFSKKFGKTEDEAFENIKKELIALIEFSLKAKTFKDIDSKFNGLFKYKVMYLYNKNFMVPCFSKEHLESFLNNLGVESNCKSYEECQHKIMLYKEMNHPDISNHQFMARLYQKYGDFLTKNEIRANDELDRKVNDDLNKKDDDEYEIVFDYAPEPLEVSKKIKAEKDVIIYARKPEYARFALRRAQYKCENDESHKSFTRRSNNKPYMEVHHLIPMCFQGSFSNSLDNPANIVSLCSNCHNEIHYGKNADKLIEKLYEQRKDELKKAKIFVTLDELKSMYSSIRNKR